MAALNNKQGGASFDWYGDVAIRAIQARVDNALRKGAELVVNQAKANIAHDTYKTRDKIKVLGTTSKEGVATIRVGLKEGKKADRGHIGRWLEFGTIHTPKKGKGFVVAARPWLYPALKEKQYEVMKVAKAELQAAIKGTAPKGRKK